ncbi:benzoate 4-monooxygenase cytochrome P450 [Lentithecium fluviatile CBS 122367]|uniref:Benzoate 4-monooxygenase cytochrome P450 n=1 Tax=Lentithecium fluviatile CBS 122367 TaxID=1168545 RepID=A0A6G1IHB2_9PLEO|nr:benzoate 4-monooxygenase cytochrome P450 [Lentithecium fluviatile CBS 122367]
MKLNSEDPIFAIVRTIIIPGFIAFAVYQLVLLFRLRYLHPLARFPGPPLAAISNFPYSKSYLGGRQPYDFLALHEKYGPVVRTAPNELSFSTPEAWRDIYGQRNGHQTFTKTAFYDGGSFANQASSIVTERDPSKHRNMRKYLANAFSDRSLKDQEHLIAGVIDAFVEQIGHHGRDKINLMTWFNLMTFDVIGELAFGKSFGGVDSGKVHEWIAIVLASMGQASFSDTLARFPLLGKIYMRIRPGWLKSLTEGSKTHETYTLDLVSKRIAAKTDRKDFMTSILDSREEYGISEVQLAAHASDFVIAGSETTATCLATVMYYVLHAPEIESKMRHEIRSAFASYDEIDAKSAAKLSFVHAVCLEALRVYPPLPLGLPRTVPAGGDTVGGIYVPEATTVYVSPFAASMSSLSFDDPWQFRPERWLQASETDILDASQPFSMGTRACLGRSLAWMELHTCLAKMYYRYDFELLSAKVDWQKDSEMHLLWKKPNLFVRVHPRLYG